jgi:hypothetical protein
VDPSSACLGGWHTAVGMSHRPYLTTQRILLHDINSFVKILRD